MGLRPVPARWFQALAARDDLARLAEALARSGVVQLEAGEEVVGLPESPELAARLAEYDQLARRYQAWWPADVASTSGTSGPPELVVTRALECVRAWCARAEPVIARLERVGHERAELLVLRELLESVGEDFPPLDPTPRPGGLFASRLYVVPRDRAATLEFPGPHLVRRVTGPEHAFVLVVAVDGQKEAMEQALLSARARPLDLPPFARGLPADVHAAVVRRLAVLDGEDAAGRAEVGALRVADGVAAALADLVRLRWFSTRVPPIPQTRNFAVVTGWTRDFTGERLRRSLTEAGVQALVDFPPMPPHRDPPVLLDNPPWIRPFETFARLLGVPSSSEADPSAVLAVIAPLMFGFMFGDVGQGALLIVVGLLLRHRLPILRMLIPWGAAAMVFGVLFGSVFAREDVIPAAWLHPLTSPLPVLAAAVAGGAVVLLVGLLLDGLEASWRGALRTWLVTDAAVIVIYLAVLGLVRTPWAGVVAVAGVAWHVFGAASLHAGSRWAQAGAAAGHLVERVLQLLVNTVSFARVGAFALAHAGLCSAISALADSAGHAVSVAAVLVVGNVFCVVLEGLVVSIQTTRLVLFEFFVRFLRGEGRAFRPLLPPRASGAPPWSPEVHAP